MTELRVLSVSKIHAAVITAAWIVAACAGRQPWKQITFGVLEDTVIMRRTAEGASFRVSGVVKNNSSEPAYLGGSCAPDAQREIDHVWQTIWYPVCVDSSGTRKILPGDSVLLPILIYGSSKPHEEPHLDPRMQPGRYRVRVGIGFLKHPQDDRPLLRIKTSPTFIVRDALVR